MNGQNNESPKLLTMYGDVLCRMCDMPYPPRGVYRGIVKADQSEVVAIGFYREPPDDMDGMVSWSLVPPHQCPFCSCFNYETE